MAAEFSKTVSLQGAHRIDENFLRRLGKMVSDYVQKPIDFVFTLIDDSEMRASNLEDITNDTAFISAFIKKVALRGSTYEVPARAVTITFDDGCQIRVSGIRGSVSALISEIQNLFASVETGYSFVNKFWGMKLRAIISCASGVSLSYYIMTRYPEEKFDAVTGSMTLCFIFFLIIGGIEGLKDYIFPRVDFRIAANSNIIDTRQIAFRNIFWGVIVAGALGYAVNIATK